MISPKQIDKVHVYLGQIIFNVNSVFSFYTNGELGNLNTAIVQLHLFL